MSNTILPHELPRALDRHPEAEILSLDCFDTLLWRNTNAPKDVFSDLHAGGINAFQRTMGEGRARAIAIVEHARHEVTFDEIYENLMPNASADVRRGAIERELAAETRHCFPFAPTVALMREAKARGLKVVVVSDTYLSTEQLTDLIRDAAGEDVLALIDRIFCSSEYGKPKAGGLFQHVLAELHTVASKVLHLGDNRTADLVAPQSLGMSALHLVQFDGGTLERLRLEVAGASIFDQGVRNDLPAFQPHRAALAVAQPALADPVFALGYAALGPIFHGFSRWIRREAEAVADRTGKRVHLMFLMRDGHLPKIVYEAGDDGRFPVCSGEISRFTSSAATLTDDKAIIGYVKRSVAQNLGVRYTLGCLLFPPAEIAQLAQRFPDTRKGLAALLRYVSRPQTLRLIARRSDAFRKRMIRHVAAASGIEEGETLMLIDLGYNGTVQNNVAHLIEDSLKVQVAGRYLLLREGDISGLDKAGFVDERLYDARALHALSGSVALLEQLATIDQGSVIDYDGSGGPIRKRNTIAPEQQLIRDNVQQACVAFARECDAASHRRPASDDVAWDHGGAACMVRLLFLPTETELKVLDRFEHDINLGTSAHARLFDTASAERELKRQGAFYVKEARRMYLPGELRPQGLPLTLTAISSWRLDLDLKRVDFTGSGVEVPVLVAGGEGVSNDTVRAIPTHDGYFVASVPVGTGQYAIGFQFPKLYDWLQVEAAWFAPSKSLVGMTDAADMRDANCIAEGLEEMAPGLFRATDEAGFLLVPPVASDQQQVLNIVFRPIKQRETSNVHQLERPAALPKAAAA